MRRQFAGVLLVAFLTVGMAASQVVVGPRFSVYKETILSGAAEVITIQQPASGSKRVHFEWLQIHSTVAFVMDMERDGAAATATTLTPADASKRGAATATAWSGSNVGAGTKIAEFDIPANQMVPIDLRGYELALGAGTGENMTFRGPSMTGTIKVLVVWREQ